jgi:hypothetical protein
MPSKYYFYNILDIFKYYDIYSIEKVRRAMSFFEEYLKQHQIDPLALTVAAQVRYLIIYNAMKDKPISSTHAKKIRAALQRFTGSAYPGSLLTIEGQSIDQLPTIKIRNSH